MSDDSTLKLSVDTTEVKRGADDLDRLTDAGTKAAQQSNLLEAAYTQFGRALGALGLAATAAETIKLADAYTLIQSRLKLVTDGTDELANVEARLFDVAQRNKTPFADTVQLYQRLALGATELGASQDQLVKLTDAVGAALRLSGASAGTAAGGLLQLSQSFAGPVTQAQEFNSLVDAMPELLRAAAKNIDGAGGSIAGLRTLVLEGKLATSDFFQGILKGSDDLISKSQNMQVTVGQALTNLQNSFLALVGAQNQTTGATATLANGIEYLAGHLDTLLAITKGLGTAVLAKYFLEAAAAMQTKIAATLADIEASQLQRAATIATAEAEVEATAARRASLTAAQAGIVLAREEAVAKLASANSTVLAAEAQIKAATSAGALSGALALVRQGEISLAEAMGVRSAAMAELAILGQQQVRASAQIAAATEAQALAQTGLTAATTAGGVAARLGASALGLLGGPIGAIVTVLGLGVTAWELWGSSSERAEKQTKSAVNDSADAIIASLDKEIVKLQQRLDLLKQTAVVLPTSNAASKAEADALDEAAAALGRYNAAAAQTGKNDVENIVLERQRQTALEDYSKALQKHDSIVTRTNQVTALKAQLDQNDTKNTKELADLRAKANGVNEKWVEDLTHLDQLRQKGLITDAEQATLAQKLTDLAYKKNKAESDGLQTYRDLIASSNANVVTLRQQAASTDKVTTSQEKLNKLQADIEAGVVKFNKALYDQTARTLTLNAAQEKQLDIDDRAKKATLAANEAREKYNETITSATSKLNDQIAEQKAANESALLGSDALAKLTVARLRDSAASLESQAIRQLDKNLDEETYNALIAQAKALRDLADLKEQGISIKAAQDANKAWQEVTKSVYDGLSDSLFRAFEAGKGFFSTFWDGLKNTIKTTVLKLGIQVVLNGTGLTGLLGASNALASTGGAAGGLGGLSGLGSLGSLGASLADAGSLFGLGLQGSIAGFGASGFLGGISGALTSASSLLGSGSIAGALGAALPVLGPLALGIFGLTKLFGDHSKWSLGSSASGTIGAGGLLTNLGQSPFNFGNNTNKDSPEALKTLISTLGTTIFGTAAALGGNAQGLSVTAATDLDRNNTESAILALLRGGNIVAGIQTGSGAFGAGNPAVAASKQSADTISKFFQDSLPVVVVQGLQLSNLPKRFQDFFSSVSAASLTADQAQAMLTTAASVKSLGDALTPLGGVFGQLSDLGVQATADLANLTGGFDQFLSKAQDYVSKFYTDGEQAAIQAAQVQATLLAAGVDTSSLNSKEAYRALVDSLNLGTTAGQQEFAALINSASTFANIADYLSSNHLTLAQLAAQTPGGALAQAAAQPATPQEQAQPVIDSLTSLGTTFTDVGGSISQAVSDSGATQAQATNDVQASLESGLAALNSTLIKINNLLASVTDGGDAMLTRPA
jgi:tape measure domain-containing protein